MNLQIRALTAEDWPHVRRIYLEGIATGNATFETEAPSWDKWDSHHRPDCRLVVLGTEGILGWAALSPVSSRRVYAGVAEVSVYVAEHSRGKGAGRALLQALLRESEACGIWTLQAGIFPENVSSISLHKSCGFREVGIRERVGQLQGKWRDVVLLERRSSIAGV